MFEDRNLNPAAEVREDLAEPDLIAKAKRLQGEIVQSERLNLKRARDLGLLLICLKKAKRGLYCRELEEIGISTQRASEYVRIAKSRAPGLLQCGSIREALQLIAQGEGESAESEDDYRWVDELFVPRALDPTISYLSIGTYQPPDAKYAERVLPEVEAGSEVWLCLDPHPDHAGYWVYSFHFVLPAGKGFAIACGRGMRLEASDLTSVIRSHGMRPAEWFETAPRLREEIDALRWYEEDFEASCRTGKWVSDRVADLLWPLEEREQITLVDEQPEWLPEDEIEAKPEGTVGIQTTEQGGLRVNQAMDDMGREEANEWSDIPF